MDRHHPPSRRRRRQPRPGRSRPGRSRPGRGRDHRLARPVAAALVVVTALELGDAAGPHDATSEGIAVAAPPGGASPVVRRLGGAVAPPAPEGVGGTAGPVSTVRCDGSGDGTLVEIETTAGCGTVAPEAVGALTGGEGGDAVAGGELIACVGIDAGGSDASGGVTAGDGASAACEENGPATAVGDVGADHATGGATEDASVGPGGVPLATGEAVVSDGQPARAVLGDSRTEDADAVLDDAGGTVSAGVEGPAVAGSSAERRAPPDSGATPWPERPPSDRLGAAVCVETSGAKAITDLFAGDRLVLGADYQRAHPLPDGRVLWLFQDAFVPTADGPRLVHNVGLVQSGRCFQLLRSGSTGRPTDYLFPTRTEPFRRWFWPLGGEVGADGDLHVFVAEMQEHGPGYLDHTEPVGTWIVTIDPVTLAVVDERPAPDRSASLYGWSVVSWGAHSYLYAHCYRQFGWDPFPFADPGFLAHDWDCAADVTVARVPRGRFDATPRYWDGAGWVDDPGLAVAVFPRWDRPVNPVQVAVIGGRLVAATKVGDWWGDTVHLDTAVRPEGPWATYDTVAVPPRCDVCNTYFASILPYEHDGTTFTVAISNNTWRGTELAHYEPSVFAVPMPAAAR